MNKPLFLIFLFVVPSCATYIHADGRGEIEKIKSQNHIIRNRLILIERRNSIVEEENIARIREIQEKQAQYENLAAEKKALLEKSASDMHLMNEKYRNLEEKSRILEKESSRKIQDMALLNRNLEGTLGSKILMLNEEIKKRELNFGNEMERIKKEHARNVYELSIKAEELKKTISNDDDIIHSLDLDLSELSGRIKKLSGELMNKNDIIRGLIDLSGAGKDREEELRRLLSEKEKELIESKKRKDIIEMEKSLKKGDK